jgi:crotonobetainyl-CoA:carnitine CoA-transferase CaiB-like acyl-CoA transferase
MNRDRTGTGGRIDISMLECLTEWMMAPIYVWQGSGKAPARTGMRHNMLVPYGIYPCADGAVIFSIQNEREWRRFCAQVLRMPSLAEDERFATNASRVRNRVELENLIEERFRTCTRSDALALLEEADIASGALNDVAAVVTHPQLQARHRWVEVASPVGMIPAFIPPHNLQHVPSRMGAVPALGEHTQEVLAELGLRRSE